MTISGPAIFFDGATSARQEVTVDLGASAMTIYSPDGLVLAEWPYAEIAAFSAPEGVLRLGRTGNPMLARLEIRDPQLAAAFRDHAGAVKQVGAIDRRTRVKVVGWSLAAVVSAVLLAVFAVPAIVTRVTPLVPTKIEQRFGRSVDSQLRFLLNRGGQDEFECGNTAATRAGRAAFEKLVHELEAAAALPLPVRADVVRRPDANAITLPGGRIYVFEGLIAKAENVDELAGVIAHEMGHVAHRDSVRAVIQTAGLSFLFGMLIGDFSGGGAAILATRTVLQSSYSRETEAAADAFGAALMAKLGRDPRALGAILVRIAGTPTGPTAKILLDHPEAQERAAAIAAIQKAALGNGSGTGAGLLTASEWSALKRICATGANASGSKAPTRANAPRDTEVPNVANRPRGASGEDSQSGTPNHRSGPRDPGL